MGKEGWCCGGCSEFESEILFSFYAGKTFCAYLFLSFRMARRKNFWCVHVLKLQNSYAGKTFGAYDLGTRHGGACGGLGVGCVASSREVGMGLRLGGGAVRTCVPGV